MASIRLALSGGGGDCGRGGENTILEKEGTWGGWSREAWKLTVNECVVYSVGGGRSDGVPLKFAVAANDGRAKIKKEEKKACNTLQSRKGRGDRTVRV